MTTNMWRIALKDGFGINKLIREDVPRPRPDHGQVLIRHTAASLNFRDLHVIGGVRALPLPLVPLSDTVGVVVDVGPGVSRWKPGQRVSPIFIQNWHNGEIPSDAVLPTLGGPLDGILSEYGVWPQDALVEAPATLSDIEAACLPCAAVSAWDALFVAGQTKVGDHVVLQGTGGVSLFALQFAKAAGASVIITSSSDAKLDRCREMGADHVINYRSQPGWGDEVRRITGVGADLVVDVGGMATLPQTFIALRNGGAISSVGNLGGMDASIDLGLIGAKGIRYNGIRVGSRLHHEKVAKVIDQHGLRPVVDRLFDVFDVQNALRYLESGAHFGKVALAFPEQGGIA